MPDLMSHLIIGFVIAELLNVKKKSLVAFGAIAPDLFAKFHLVYIHFGIFPYLSFVSLHTPFMSFLLSIIIAPLFLYDRLKIILFFNLGAISHYLSDLAIKHFTMSGTRILFPISNHNYTLNLIWPEQSIYVLIASSVIYLAIKFFKRDLIITPGKIKFNL